MPSNIFEATCVRCGKLVAPGAGFVGGKVGKNWHVTHNDCIPKADHKIYRKLEYDL